MPGLRSSGMLLAWDCVTSGTGHTLDLSLIYVGLVQSLHSMETLSMILSLLLIVLCSSSSFDNSCKTSQFISLYRFHRYL